MNDGAYINILLNQENHEYTEQDINNMEDLKNRFFDNKTIESQEQKNKYNRLLLFIKRQKKKLQEKQEKEKLNKLTTNINKQTKRVVNEKANIEKLLDDIDVDNINITEEIDKIKQMKNNTKLDAWIDSELDKLSQQIKEINDKIAELKQNFETNINKSVSGNVSLEFIKKYKLKGGISSENMSIISTRYIILKKLKALELELVNILTINIPRIIDNIKEINHYEEIFKKNNKSIKSELNEDISITMVNFIMKSSFSKINIPKLIQEITEICRNKYEFIKITNIESIINYLIYIVNYVLFYIIYFTIENNNENNNEVRQVANNNEVRQVANNNEVRQVANNNEVGQVVQGLVSKVANNNEVGQVVQGLVSNVANNNEVGQVVQGLVSNVANMKGGTVLIEKEINLCSNFLKSKSELADIQNIINSIKTNRYFYDTLYVLFIDCLNKLINLEKSKIKIKIDKLPANYSIDSDFYYTQLSIQHGFNIEIIIKEKMRYLCYTLKNRKHMQIQQSNSSMFSTNELEQYMNSLKYNIERMKKEQEKFVKAVDEKNYSPDKLQFIPLSIGSSNKETLLSLVDKFLVNKSILKELIQKIKDSCDRGIIYCNDKQSILINDPKIEQYEEEIRKLEESILKNNENIAKHKETINLIYKKHLFDFFKYIQKQKIIIRKKELELKNSDNASKKSKLETEINKLKQTLDKLEENYIAVKNKFLKDQNIKKLVINVLHDMHKYQKELELILKINNTSKLNEMNRKLNEMSKNYTNVQKYSVQIIKETKINTRTKSNIQILRIIDALNYNIRINEKQIIKKQDQINEIEKQIKQLENNSKEQNNKLKEQEEKFKKIKEETDKISRNNTQKTIQKIVILTKKFDELKTLLRLIKTKGETKGETEQNTNITMNENQLQKQKYIEEIIKQQDSDIKKITSEINLLKQSINSSLRYQKLNEKTEKLKELEQNYKYRDIKQKQIEINEIKSISRKLESKDGRRMIKDFIKETANKKRNNKSGLNNSLSKKKDIQIVKEIVNNKLRKLEKEYIELIKKADNVRLTKVSSVKANSPTERVQIAFDESDEVKGQANQGQASQGQAKQGQANDEIIIKTVLNKPNHTGKTIRQKLNTIFTELSQYSFYFSEHTKIFMSLFSGSGLVSYLELNKNILILINELTTIIKIFDGKKKSDLTIKNQDLFKGVIRKAIKTVNGLTKHKNAKNAEDGIKVKDSIKDKLQQCLEELKKLSTKKS